MADHKRVGGLAIGASELQRTFSGDNDYKGFAQENAARISKVNDSTLVARAQDHSP